MAAKKAAKKQSAADAIDEQLARYRSMRDFDTTAEPAGRASAKKSAALPFCIQKHAASHLHYDFRLGWNGVLKSWACAKGPSYFTGDKRLAVQVEDHPMEYGGFEGIIPQGQYGGGTVMLWDQGTWEPQPGHTDVDAGLRDGSLKFILHGTKMKGKWALIRMGGKAASEKKPNWLLIKEHDEFERTKDDPAITDEAAKSVVTDRTLEQIAAGEDHVWNSKETASATPWYRKDAPAEPAKPATGNLAARLKALPKEHQPSFVKPQLALEATEPPEGAGWLHELKLDGYRIQARKDGAKVQMLTRSGLDWTARMAAIAAEIGKLPVDAITLDGEAVVLASDGNTDFARLQAAFQEDARNPLTYFCFDLLHLDGRNTRDLPLRARKEILAEALAGADQNILRVSEHLESNGEAMFKHACELHAEGILSKKADAAYAAGRGSAWLKSKCLREQEFVIGGYTLPSNGSHGIGALLLGYYEGAKLDKLIYAGRTGTGFTHAMSAKLRDRLDALETKEQPFDKIDAEGRRGAHWVSPELVAQVRFATWTADRQVRQAAFLGLREDKAAKEVTREEPTVAPQPKRPGKTTKVAAHAVKPKIAAKVMAPATIEHAPVRLTHPEKILDAESKLTKQQLADFYWVIADRMLPYIADRPLSLVRCPEGSEKPCFFQKHVNHMLPPGIGSVDVPDKKTGAIEPYITLNTREALAGLAQMGVLEVHPWGSRNADLEHADMVTIDLDPDPSLAWEVLAGAAEEARDRLKKMGLTSFVKTTGGKGLHVVFPIEPDLTWPQVKEWAHAFVLTMEKANPSLYLTKMSKAARTGKIYLDYLRNERGATAVAPYSPRARKGAGVAVPLAWSELKEPEHPHFHVGDFAEWAHRLKRDVWAALPKTQQRITQEAMRAVGMKGLGTV
jgi:bifunctional non-homologous end joining protein LigD